MPTYSNRKADGRGEIVKNMAMSPLINNQNDLLLKTVIFEIKKRTSNDYLVVLSQDGWKSTCVQ